MAFDRAQSSNLDRFGAALRLASEPKQDLIQTLIDGVCTRLPNLGTKASRHIGQMMEAGAFTDAALALLRYELPQWSLRRLVCDDGEWLCALSRQPHMPESLDDTADGHHAIAALAILDAFLEARRRTIVARERQARTVPSVRAVPEQAICCDNFS